MAPRSDSPCLASRSRNPAEFYELPQAHQESLAMRPAITNINQACAAPPSLACGMHPSTGDELSRRYLVPLAQPLETRPMRCGESRLP